MRGRGLISKLISSVQAAAVPDPDGMTAVVGGSAVAVGTSTLATGQVVNQMVDKGAYTIAKGGAKFVASATTLPDGTAAVGATTFAAVEGADLVISVTRGSFKAGATGAAATSQTRFIAIDVDGWAPEGGAIQIDLAAWGGRGQAVKAPAGNLATVDASAGAAGDNTVAATDTQSFAIENQYSSVSAVALTGIA